MKAMMNSAKELYLYNWRKGTVRKGLRIGTPIIEKASVTICKRAPMDV